MVYHSYKVYSIFNGKGGKIKIFVADNFFSIFADCHEENMMDFEFMTSKQIKQKGR